MKSLKQLKKAELIWLATHRCKHGHTYIEHLNCAKQDGVYPPEEPERIGFIDIETSNLSADFGIILSYAIKELDGKIFSRVITPEELKSKIQDRGVVSECVARMEDFDRLIGFYSSRFDIPYIRSRALAGGISFPNQGEIKHTDLWFSARSKMKLHRNRLQVVCDFLSIPSKDHKLDGLRWTKALTGDKKALKHILIHNQEDVVSTELAYKKLRPFFKLTNAYV